MNKFQLIIKFLLLVFPLFSSVTMAFATTPDTIQQQINQFISQAEFEAAKTYIQSNLADVAQKQYQSELHYELVKILFIQSDYNEALKIAFYALDKTTMDRPEKVKFNFMIGCIYSAIKDYQKSLEYFDHVVNEGKMPSLLIKAHLLSSELHLESKDSVNAKMQMGVSFTQEESDEEMNQEDTIEILPTGNTKTIQGYQCNEYKMTGKDMTATIWVTKDVDIRFPNELYSINPKGKKKKNKNFDQAWLKEIDGWAMEMVMIDSSKRKPHTIIMNCLSILPSNMKINSSEYQSLGR